MPYDTAEKQKAWYQENKESVLWRHIYNKYGITKADFDALLEKQDNSCAICLVPFEGLKRREMHIDHCHDKQHIRGILCMKCNVGLGMLGDNAEGLIRALSYVTKENAVGRVQS